MFTPLNLENVKNVNFQKTRLCGWKQRAMMMLICGKREFFIATETEEQSDLEKFIELYRSVGMKLKPFVNEQNKENGYQYLQIIADWDDEETGKTIGYNGFYTRLYFDESGKFIQQGIWE
jgi:hypothetical protein